MTAVINFFQVHLPFVLQTLTMLSIICVLFQIKLTDEIDQLRWASEPHNFLLIEVRRAGLIFKLFALIWIVVYTDDKGWQPWPPYIAFIAAFNAYVIADILLLRQDRKRLRENISQGHINAT